MNNPFWNPNVLKHKTLIMGRALMVIAYLVALLVMYWYGN
jgi:hypothetical protein